MKELPKAYDPKGYEDTIYKGWEESGLFNPDVCVEKGVTKKSADPFTIVLPPPNVTGTLHMGHAVMLAVEDVMIRYHRMKGDKTLWVPGTDHAAVATESKVEGLLIKEEGLTKPKEELGKEQFLDRVRQFASESHDTIVNQARKMGSSLDWSREAFTLDEARNRAVRTVFKRMYDDGLIYRGYRVVNWSVKGQSTCSDDELVYIERPATLYFFKYSKDFPITIATTRPETKLGDTAVAVHPDDERYKQYIGKTFTVDVGAAKPLLIHIIANEGIDPAFGTGALGVTPAHSPIDFEMYLREKAKGNDIGLIPVIGEDGRMTANAGKYAGLTVEEAREAFVQYLRDQDLLEKEEEITQNAGTSDRFKDVVEPLPKTQWFVNVNQPFSFRQSKKHPIKGLKDGDQVTLKQLMQTVVRNEQIAIVPERFVKTYFHWIDNLRDWCISRQIWYGHQIPVWYRGEEMYVGVEAPEGSGWVQDPDTLDTWFSSGLWTFSTLGWPDDTQDMRTFHPTSVLETGYDILFFWVARMILMTTYTLGEIPFETVYLHGLVRDEKGRKMSKSLGNIIDPLDMIEKYGTDATRLSLLVGGTPGNDMKLSEEKVAGFRNFTNKLWNISRFMLLNIEAPKADTKEPKAKTMADEWILERLQTVVNDTTKDLEQYQFSGAGERLRDFTWGELADWYLEIAKIEGEKSAILNYMLNTILKLWHPFMPFVTEAIWQEVYGKEEMLLVASWPKTEKAKGKDIVAFSAIQNIITGIRSLRADYAIDPAKKLSVMMVPGKKKKEIKENEGVITSLARLSSLTIAEHAEKTPSMVGFVTGGVDVYVDLAGVVDVEKEKLRLQKEIDTVAPYVASIEKKLSNDGFVNNASPDVVEKERQKLDEAKEKLHKLHSQLASLI
ncbi:MAG TPA: valine--tRNA ligase [Candidatus Kapabacteria bacterium]|nr:valine--tRNA ligase [Candidatus Kapabacteria bacterium]